MWASLCNFLCDKLLFYKPEVKSGVSRNDNSVCPFYGKRLKLSNPDCETNGLLNQAQTPQRFPMQAKENLTNNDDEEECCVIAEIPKRKIAGPSSSSFRKYNGVFKRETPTTGGLFSSSSFQGKSFSKDNIIDIEVRCVNNSEKDVIIKTPNKTSKFFTTQRSSLSQSKLAKSRMSFKTHLKRKLNFLQESYRLTEKIQYIQLLQSHTSYNLLSITSSVKSPKCGPEKIPVIDLTKDKNNEGDIYRLERCKSASPKPTTNSLDDQDVQIIGEVPGVPEVRSFQDIIKFRPVNTKEAFQKMLTKHSKNSPEILNITDLEQDAITLLDDEEDRKKKSYSDSLEERLRTFMQITGPSNQEVENDLEEQYFPPELTPEQEKRVKEALKPGPSHEVLAEGFNLTIARRDMETLSGLNWLNDEIINFYMHLIMERSKKNKALPRVYAFNTFFYPKLVSSGYASLRRWTKQVDIFSFDMILVPIHLEMHWCLSVIDFRCKSVKYYDSVGAPNNVCLERLLSYLRAESLDKKKEIFSTMCWEKTNVEDIPQQMNGSDCGVFTCMFAEYLARDSAISFTQADMPYFRKKIVIEILQGKLLT